MSEEKAQNPWHRHKICSLCGTNADYQTACCRTAEHLAQEVERLKADNERMAWNLAGCLTYAEGFDDGSPHSLEWATPALNQVQLLAKKYKRAEKQARELAEALKDLLRDGMIMGDENVYHADPEKAKEALAAFEAGDSC